MRNLGGASLLAALAMMTAACSAGVQGTDNASMATALDGQSGVGGNAVSPSGVSLRTPSPDDIRDARPGYPLQGVRIPTPSDTRTAYYLLRHRAAANGEVVAIIRHELGDKISYARVAADCRRGLFHVLGVGDTRGRAEANNAKDGPLRATTGKPLRAEMLRFICEKEGTPVALPAS